MLERTAEVATGTVRFGRRIATAAQVRRRRIRNRENMRRRREDPAFRAFEKQRRERREGGVEHSGSFEIVPPVVAAAGKFPRRCSICRKRDAVEVITRLRPCATVRSGFVQMRIAYCGFC
jgi:hypothetical protein